jgi:hypothetical protein
MFVFNGLENVAFNVVIAIALYCTRKYWLHRFAKVLQIIEQYVDERSQ